MSQIELSEKTGIERTALNKIERGTRKVSSDELKALAKAFNISSDSLLDLSMPSSKRTWLRRSWPALQRSYLGRSKRYFPLTCPTVRRKT